MFILYCTLLSVQYYICKNNVHTLIWKYFIAKQKVKSSSALSASHNLFAGGVCYLDVDENAVSMKCNEAELNETKDACTDSSWFSTWHVEGVR